MSRVLSLVGIAGLMIVVSSFRSVIMGFLVAGVLPMINTYGPLVTNVVSGILSLIGFG